VYFIMSSGEVEQGSEAWRGVVGVMEKVAAEVVVLRV